MVRKPEGSDIFRETRAMQMPVKGGGVGRPVREWLVSEAAEPPVQFVTMGASGAYFRVRIILMWV